MPSLLQFGCNASTKLNMMEFQLLISVNEKDKIEHV